MKSTTSAHDYLQKAGNVSMEYLNIFKTKLASTVVDTVYAAENITKTVLPGNPVTRDYEVTKHVGSAGPALLWTLYNGYKKSTKQEATIFVLHKKNLDHFSKRERELIIDAFKKGATQLARIKHPRILSLQHQLEESKDSLAFATELCFCSLANVLGQHDNAPNPLPIELEQYKLYEVEIKYGLMQLAEALSFIHKDVKILHRNICPESIILNANGAWKLAGFELFLTNIGDPNESTRFPFKEWDGSIPVFLNQQLDYLAPEYGLSNKCDSSSDMFSYGMLFFAVFNNGKTLYNCNNNYQTFVNNVEELKKLTNSQMNLIPSDVREYLKMLLHINNELRPDASQVMRIPFFDDVAVKTLEYLDSSFQNDNLQKSVFFKSLPQIIDKLPQRVCLQRIIPCLEQEFINADMIPFLLPSIFLIAEQSTNEEYVKYILPRLKYVFKLQKPLQVVLIVLRNMNIVLSKTPPVDIKEHILPMVCRALEAETLEIQELCLSSLPSFANLLDQQSIKHLIIPRIRKICLESPSVNLRVGSLVCTGKLIEHLEKWIVLDDILPILEKISSRESSVLMALLGIYKIVFSHPKLGITKDMLATRVLPFLIPLSIDNNLNMSQSHSYLALIKEMLNQVEIEHKKKLEQIEAMEKEKSIIPYSLSNLSGSKPRETINQPQNSMMDKIMMSYGVGNSSTTIPPPGYQGDTILIQQNPARTNLSLKEKQELAIQFERVQIKGSSENNSFSHNIKAQSKDMTESMISKNLSGLDMTSSTNKTTIPSTNSGLDFSQFITNSQNNVQKPSSFNNEYVGFFGNLALPAPPDTHQNMPKNGVQVKSNLDKQPASHIPLIPTPSKLINTSNTKIQANRSAFEDLNDIFG